MQQKQALVANVQKCRREAESLVGRLLRVKTMLKDCTDDAFEQIIISRIQMITVFDVENDFRRPAFSCMKDTSWLCIDLTKAWTLHRQANRQYQEKVSPLELLSALLASASRALPFLTQEEFKKWVISSAQLASWMQMNIEESASSSEKSIPSNRNQGQRCESMSFKEEKRKFGGNMGSKPQ